MGAECRINGKMYLGSKIKSCLKNIVLRLRLEDKMRHATGVKEKGTQQGRTENFLAQV